MYPLLIYSESLVYKILEDPQKMSSKYYSEVRASSFIILQQLILLIESISSIKTTVNLAGYL